MTIKVQITTDDGKVIKRSGAITNWQELKNPSTNKAYGWNVNLIFNEFQPAAIPDNTISNANV